MGYSRVGFDQIVGVDNRPQPRYPFKFVQGDALEYLEAHGREFDVIHASPPCQGYSIMRNLPWNQDRTYPLLIEPTKGLLETIGKPWVVENVMGAHLDAGWLCRTMFGLPFYRHRSFLSNWFWFQPGHPKHQHTVRPGRSLAGRAREFVFDKTPVPFSKRQVGIGHSNGWSKTAEAMGIDWMKREELTQAIPPAYTEYIGNEMLRRW